jgi:Fe-S-cluster containining protein
MDQHKAMMVETCYPNPGAAFTSDGRHNGKAWRALKELREEVLGGLLYTHSRANSNTRCVHEAASTLYALIELLEEKGIITAEELDERKAMVAERVEKQFLDNGMGVKLQESGLDKYAFRGEAHIDCGNRVHICKAACCRMWFPLSRQDINEGVLRWDLRFPYVIARDAEGYCKHLERATGRCTVYQNRPIPCRAFDCRTDQRIWLDFENQVINPDLEEIFQGNGPVER